MYFPDPVCIYGTYYGCITYMTSSTQPSANSQDEVIIPPIFFSIKSLSSSILVGIWVKVSFLRQQVFGGGEYSQGFRVKKEKRLKIRNACLTYRTEQNVEGKQRGKNKMNKN